MKSKQPKRDNVTDLTGYTKTPEPKYLCKLCTNKESILLFYPAAKIKNPHNAKPYVCPTCGMIYDLALEKMPKATRSINSKVANENTFFFTTISENKGLNPVEDQYRKYDPEPDADQHLINSGATILDSRIELTDSQGRNRTVVKRDRDMPSIRPVNTFD